MLLFFYYRGKILYEFFSSEQTYTSTHLLIWEEEMKNLHLKTQRHFMYFFIFHSSLFFSKDSWTPLLDLKFMMSTWIAWMMQMRINYQLVSVHASVFGAKSIYVCHFCPWCSLLFFLNAKSIVISFSRVHVCILKKTRIGSNNKYCACLHI